MVRRLLWGLVSVAVLASAAFGVWKWHPWGKSTDGKPPGEDVETQAPKEFELDEAKQKYIWDTEHITFELETHFCKPFAKAVMQRDEKRLLMLARADFEGYVLDSVAGTTLPAGAVSERRREGRGQTLSPLRGAEFARAVLASVNDFAKIDKVMLKVLQIDRSERDGERWVTKLLFTVQGTNREGGRLELEAENDVEFRFAGERAIKKKKEPVLARWQVTADKLRGSPRVLMKEVTEQVGLADLPIRDNWKLPCEVNLQYRFQMAVEDFDRDGFPDIAIATYEGTVLLLRSVDGRRYEDVTSKMGIRQGMSTNYMVAWIDYDNDGYPDLLIGGRLYHNIKGERFEDVTAQSGLKFAGQPMGCAVADYDGDGLLDLYVIYQHPEGKPLPKKSPWVLDPKTGAYNQLWRNLGGGRFRDVTAESGAGRKKGCSFAAAWFYLDRDDRFPSLYIANDFGQNVMLRNKGDGTFEDITEATRTGDYSTSMGVAIGDLDNDGVPEIYVANMYSKMGRRIIAHVEEKDYPPGIYEHIKGACAGNRLYARRPGQRAFTDLSHKLGINAVGWAYAPAMADFDGDGWLDLFATTGFMSFQRDKPDG
jgi:hypothetical protein